jgi:hypothetical protein
MVAAQPAIAVSVPLTGANVLSPINIQASAVPSPGHNITGWVIYLDEVAVYHAGAVSSINAYITASKEAHTVLVRAWDSSGAFGSQTLSLQVQTVAVNISVPLNGAVVDSPVNIQATAASAHTITGWIIYVDGVDSFTQNNVNSINANVAMNPGTHSVMVRAWDSAGSFGDQTIRIVVQ